LTPSIKRQWRRLSLVLALFFVLAIVTNVAPASANNRAVDLETVSAVPSNSGSSNAITTDALDLDGWIATSSDSVVQYFDANGRPIGPSSIGAMSSEPFDVVPTARTGQGYIVGADELLDSYVIRLVAAPNIERLRPYAELVASELSRSTARRFTVAPGVISASNGATGFIDLTANAGVSPCGTWGNSSGGTWGCGGYRAQFSMGGHAQVTSGSVWLAPFVIDGLSEANLVTLMLHEFGHAVSLDHYSELYDGQRQVMYPQISPATHSRTYRSGDANGLQYLTIPKSSSSGQPVTPADRLDPQNQAWVSALLHDLLGPERAAAAISEWQQKARSGLTRTQMARFLTTSPVWTEKVVSDLYREALGRAPDAGGAQYWGAQLARGVQTPAIAAHIWGSAERVAQAGSAENWVRALYDGLLGRAADSSGMNFWVGESSRVGFPRVASTFYQSYEKRVGRVTEQYKLFLGRNPDGQGAAYWARRLLSAGDIELTVELVNSQEYRMRAINRFPNG